MTTGKLKLRPATFLAVALAMAGTALRLINFGQLSFWSDEAWVALSSRVDGWRAFLLAASHTPVLWALTIRALSILPIAREISLRLLPLFFGCLTMWAAYRAGGIISGGPAGSILALATVAFDPLSIVYSQQLKHFTAESAFAVLALERLASFFATGRTRDMVLCFAVMGGGLPFSNAQLFLIPPLLGGLLCYAAVRRDGRRARQISCGGLLLAAWTCLYFEFLIAPTLTPALFDYWSAAYVPAGSFTGAASFIRHALLHEVRPLWSSFAVYAALGAIMIAFVAIPAQRLLALVVAALVAELALLSTWKLVPFNEPRIVLFLITTLAVYGVASLILVLDKARTVDGMRSIALIAALVLAFDFIKDHPWPRLIHPWPWLMGRHELEDSGPLIEFLESARREDERLLVYHLTMYTYAYYRHDRPVIVPDQSMTMGYRPVFGANVTVVDWNNFDGAVAEAFARSSRVWLLASRLRPGERDAFVNALTSRAVTEVSLARQQALLLAVVQSPSAGVSENRRPP